MFAFQELLPKRISIRFVIAHSRGHAASSGSVATTRSHKILMTMISPACVRWNRLWRACTSGSPHSLRSPLEPPLAGGSVMTVFGFRQQTLHGEQRLKENCHAYTSSCWNTCWASVRKRPSVSPTFQTNA